MYGFCSSVRRLVDCGLLIFESLDLASSSFLGETGLDLADYDLTLNFEERLLTVDLIACCSVALRLLPWLRFKCEFPPPLLSLLRGVH